MTLRSRCPLHATPVEAPARDLRITPTGLTVPCPHGHRIDVEAAPVARLMWAAYGASTT